MYEMDSYVDPYVRSTYPYHCTHKYRHARNKNMQSTICGSILHFIPPIDSTTAPDMSLHPTPCTVHMYGPHGRLSRLPKGGGGMAVPGGGGFNIAKYPRVEDIAATGADGHKHRHITTTTLPMNATAHPQVSTLRHAMPQYLARYILAYTTQGLTDSPISIYYSYSGSRWTLILLHYYYYHHCHFRDWQHTERARYSIIRLAIPIPIHPSPVPRSRPNIARKPARNPRFTNHTVGFNSAGFPLPSPKPSSASHLNSQPVIKLQYIPGMQPYTTMANQEPRNHAVKRCKVHLLDRRSRFLSSTCSAPTRASPLN